ncbi:GPP34 family phosphoprotein [Actinoplanes oblitus]|uniref:GPP34 family phosphoprotein n=1 Tax=Actinoplanes oblitus TaxID=3040509 RepID=A0ABY8WUK1_9ACTN|nr:GPP34 family phosphoprotein [Actinoplanes oblitus]WIN00080.1 GPP34 family phosphoprotein [Actinoplanes oblitus]
MFSPEPPDHHDPRHAPVAPRHAAGLTTNHPAGPAAFPAGGSGGTLPGPAAHGLAGGASQPVVADAPGWPPAAPTGRYDTIATRPPSTYRFGDEPARTRRQWPRFADELFRLAHDGAKLFVDRDLAAVGLACAVLAELVATDHLAVGQDRLVVIGRQPPPDALAHTIAEQVAGEPESLPVEDWLRYLSGDIYDQVAKRMVMAGDLVEVTRARLFGRSRTVYQPADNNAAYWSCARLATAARRGQSLLEQGHVNPFTSVFDDFDRVLVGLCLSTGVYQRVFAGTPQHVITQLADVGQRSRAPIPELLGALDRLVGGAVLIRA